MASAQRTASDRLSWLVGVEQRPEAFDFFQVLRRLDGLHADKPRLGDARRPSDEPVRLAQQPSLTFAPANVCRLEHRDDGRLRLHVRFLGVFGPQGGLPLHLSDLAHERLNAWGDATLARFADMFHHRLLAHFYRAWRQAQPAASRDRPAEDRFGVYLGALIGHASPAWHARDRVPDEAKRYFAAHLARSARTPQGLESIVSSYFGVPARVRSYSPRWMRLPADQRTRAGQAGCTLGRDTIIGARVWDAQHHCDLVIGPMGRVDYERLLPGSASLARLGDWLRNYLSEELRARINLVLHAPEVPAAKLGGKVRLGLTSWLGRRQSPEPASDLWIDADRIR